MPDWGGRHLDPTSGRWPAWLFFGTHQSAPCPLDHEGDARGHADRSEDDMRVGGGEDAEHLVAEPLTDELNAREVDRDVAKSLQSHDHAAGLGPREQLHTEARQPDDRAGPVEGQRLGVGPALEQIGEHDHLAGHERERRRSQRVFGST